MFILQLIILAVALLAMFSYIQHLQGKDIKAEITTFVNDSLEAVHDRISDLHGDVLNVHAGVTEIHEVFVPDLPPQAAPVPAPMPDPASTEAFVPVQQTFAIHPASATL